MEPTGVEPTIASPWWLPPHGRGGRACPGYISFSLRCFIFPRNFSVFTAVLCLKDECIWLHWGLSTHLIPLFFHRFSIFLS